ncbi:MAG: nickel-binding protein [Candidatus Bathyarchaeales archaeon]
MGVKCRMKFLAVHTMPTPLTREEALAIARKVKDNCTVDAYWVKSWVQLNDEEKIVKIYCEWNAKTVDDVRKLIEKLQIPLDGVYPMMADGLYPIMFDRSHPMPIAESKEIT